MLASLQSAVLDALWGQVITVEVHLSNGLPSYSIVGLPDASVKESRERVRAALLSQGYAWPLRRLTVNLAPGGFRKSGAGIEAAVAVGVLAVSEALPMEALQDTAVIGELGLDGSIRSVPGTLALVEACRVAGIGRVIVPEANHPEAALVSGIEVRSAASLRQLCARLCGAEPWDDGFPIEAAAAPASGTPRRHVSIDAVRGMDVARTLIELAAAGGHHALLTGPPGIGKTMLADVLRGLIPPLEDWEALEVTRIHSIAGLWGNGALMRDRPFHAPHHTASTPAIVGGGGGRPSPGAVTLAHRGTLFLDELAEFPTRALDALREPMEQRRIHVARSPSACEFPADFQLMGCCNTCPCAQEECVCSDAAKHRYRRRISAPLEDRFELRLRTERPKGGRYASARHDSTAGDTNRHSESQIRERIDTALARQRDRGWGWRGNAHAQLPEIIEHSTAEFQNGLKTLDRNRRSILNAVRVARTAADLADRTKMNCDDLDLALTLQNEAL